MDIVSIVVPVFNVEPYIGTLIDCLIEQTYVHWEAFLVDDHSTDRSPQIIKSYADERIHYVLRPDQLEKGAQSCRNYGMSLTKGKYMVIFDSDDLISPTCLEHRIQAMHNHPDADFCIFPADTFIGDLSTHKVARYGRQRNQDPLISFLTWRYQYTVWTNIYRSDFIKQVKWDTEIKLYQDFDFNISTLLLRPTFYFIEGEPDYFYRVGQQGETICSSGVVKGYKFLSTLKLLEKTHHQLKLFDQPDILHTYFYVFHKQYFLRLIVPGDRENLRTYVRFIHRHYSGRHYYSIVFVAWLTFIIPSQRWRNLCVKLGRRVCYAKNFYKEVIKKDDEAILDTL